MMVYGSVCSGIEAATAAWHPLGWRAAFFSEIEPFPRSVLAHHYPDVPLHGDFTTIQASEYAAIDVLVGGTPCQSFSVAGLRGGMADERGNLALEYLRLADRLRPKWLVWENVPGVLSSNGGRDFGSILGGMVELGYGFAYRVLDAQYVRTQRFPHAVPQRRRRVFVVGHFGSWQRAAAVLFERHSLRGDSAPRRQAGKGSAPGAARSVALRGREHGATAELRDDCGLTLRASGGGGDKAHVMYAPGLARCVTTGEAERQDYETCTIVAHSLRAEGFDASEDGAGRGTPLVPVAHTLGTQCAFATEDGTGRGSPLVPCVSPTLRAGGNTTGGHRPRGTDVDTCETLVPCVLPTLDQRAGRQAQGQAVAFHPTQDPISSTGACHALGTGSSQGCATAAVALPVGSDNYNGRLTGDVATTLATQSGDGVSAGPSVLMGMQVRRLTPRECERLQGFPDDFTLVPHRGKPAADGPRYKALGNSMAVNVMHWIGQRIQAVENITEAK